MKKEELENQKLQSEIDKNKAETKKAANEALIFQRQAEDNWYSKKNLKLLATSFTGILALWGIFKIIILPVVNLQDDTREWQIKKTEAENQYYVAERKGNRMPTMTDRNGRSNPLDEILREFQVVYADAVNEWNSPEEWEALAVRRSLEWKACRRIPLANASWCYSLISEYNEYRAHMIPHLWAMFHSDKIEVTPVREYSVGIYLHVPDRPGRFI